MIFTVWYPMSLHTHTESLKVITFTRLVFSGVHVARSLVLCVCFVDRCLSFCSFSFGHCVVCSSIYGFWLPLWYLQTLHIHFIFIPQPDAMWSYFDQIISKICAKVVGYIYIYVWKLNQTVLELDFCSSLDGIWTHTIDTLQHHSLSLTSSALDHSTTSTP